MTGYDFGDVVLVPFPFTDQSAVRRRPDLLIMAVTSLQSSPLSVGEVPVHDWQGAGLLKPYVLKAILTTIDPTPVLKKLGQLSATDQRALRQALRAMLE